jgi:thiol-disulfide isomerase/thioredoxin
MDFRPSKPAPAFTVQLGDGRTVASEGLPGKVVLVNFWATWCPFCRHEMPDMEEFYRDYRNQGFEILALSTEH